MALLRKEADSKTFSPDTDTQTPSQTASEAWDLDHKETNDCWILKSFFGNNM